MMNIMTTCATEHGMVAKQSENKSSYQTLCQRRQGTTARAAKWLWTTAEWKCWKDTYQFEQQGHFKGSYYYEPCKFVFHKYG